MTKNGSNARKTRIRAQADKAGTTYRQAARTLSNERAAWMETARAIFHSPEELRDTQEIYLIDLSEKGARLPELVKVCLYALTLRLYRGDGTRTWEQYLQQEHDGLSTSEADRLQKTWRLAQTVQKELGRPLPDSHLRKLQPYAERTSDQEAARAYAELYWAHQAGGVRLVANQVQQRVKKAVAAAKGVSDPAERSQAISAAWTTAPEPVMPTQRTETTPEQGGMPRRSPDPVDGALELLNVARQAIENATEDKAARKARSSEEAQRQQDAIRRIGRILSKVKVDADAAPDGNVDADAVDEDGIVDAELVED